MSATEDYDYGVEDGRADAQKGDKPRFNLNMTTGDDYAWGYVEGYRQGQKSIPRTIPGVHMDQDPTR